MILRKPYAFFIKIFKPMHIFAAVLITYLIYITNNVLSFFNSYIYSIDNVVGQSIKEELVSSSLIIIPSALIIFSLLFLGIMFNKKKPVAFYIFNMFSFLAVLVITIYVSSFLEMMEKSILSIKIVKLNHDLIVINMIIEVVWFVLLITRGLGLNFKKFSFDSDISKLSIDEDDKEEFELSINVDLETSKRNRRRALRNIKYTYLENKMVINISIVIFVVLLSGIILYFTLFSSKIKTEGTVYNMNGFDMVVNKTLLLKENFEGEKITENNLIVVDFSLKSYISDKYLFTKDFSLKIGEASFAAQTKYSDELVDLGKTYNKNILTNEFQNYLLIYEIPDKYLTSEMFLNFTSEGNVTQIKLNPQNLSNQKIYSTKKIGDEISFEESLGKISFKVNNYEIQNKFQIKYNYCFEENDCIISKEYIQPTINENFDKVVLKLSVDFSNESKVDADDFYDFFSNFGIIQYKIGETWLSQNSSFENLKSKRVNSKNKTYIGINSNILNAESIKLVFNVRNFKYEYILK